MKHIGDKISCYVDITEKGKKIVNDKSLKDKLNKEKFEIIWIDEPNRCYMVAIDPNMIGWGISEWHVLYWGIDKKFLQMKHFHVPFD